MRILHITMGNPNYKTGGLNLYCKDLAKCQRLDGHTVFLLYPESFIGSHKPHIVKRGKNMFAILDALPMAITYGIDNPKRFMPVVEMHSFISFLKNIKPDIIHVHTIQGVNKEFFYVAKQLNIPMIFTTHDYYPICLKCVLLNSENKICSTPGDVTCTKCNINAGLSAKKQRIVQSDLYQKMKNSLAIKKLKTYTTTNMKSSTDYLMQDAYIDGRLMTLDYNKIKDFNLLRKYYYDIMHCMTLIHCNSSVAYEQYSKYYSDIPMKVIPITHGGLIRCTHIRKDSKILNISYMGGMSSHKGYQIIMNAIKKLNQDVQYGWRLWMYGGEFTKESHDEKIKYQGFFTSDQVEEVWQNTDLLVVCSQCRETFGFITLEALSRGIPVLCSDLVGSKDLVAHVSKSLVFHYNDVNELANKIKKFLDSSFYNDISKKIDDIDIEFEMELHTRNITNLYREISKLQKTK